MKFSSGLFSSKFARRLFLVFILSALFPILMLAAISLQRVSNELLDQSQSELRDQVKLTGMGIYERLRFMRGELEIIASFTPASDLNTLPELPNVLAQQLTEKMMSVGWYSSEEEFQAFFGNIDEPALDHLQNEIRNTEGPFHLTTIPTNQSNSRVFIMMKDALSEDENKFIVAELNSAYLWNVESVSPLQNLCILNHNNDSLYCSNSEVSNLILRTAQTGGFGFTGNVTLENSVYGALLASYWGIFLQNDFAIDDWTVVLSTSTEEILRPITLFQNTFIAIFIVSLLFVLLISTNLIERVLTPLRILTTGIQEYSNINFQNKVVVNSNDEFSELADSFNTMGGKIAEQFQTLEAISEIDRLILSSLDSKNIIQIVLARVQEMLNCDFMGVVVEDSNKNFSTMYLRSDQKDADITELPVTFNTRDQILLKNRSQGFVVENRETAPEYTDPVMKQGSQVCLILPVIFDEDLTAVILFAYREPPEDISNALTIARGWSDRIAVALSNAKWQEKLFHQANFDTLTDLPNRLALQSHLHQSILRAERNDESIAVLFIDLDRFKLVNDSLGHSVGDQFLISIADRIRDSVRSADFVARLGGDEFTIVIAENNKIQHIHTPVSAVVDKLLSLLPQPVEFEGHTLRANASIGIAVYPNDATDAEDLMKNADSAMYQAKHEGGGTYRYFSEDLNETVANKLRTETELKRGLENKEFCLHFLPQVDLQSQALVSVESLLRWKHPKRGLLSPAEFVAIAEETNLINDLDSWVFEEVCRQLGQWRVQGKPATKVTINLSGKFFQTDHVVGRMLDRIDHYQIDINDIELEITESILISDFEKVLISINELREQGMDIALDDFGIGYSSLNYFNQLLFDKIKISRNFVKDCHLNQVNGAIVQTIISLAKNMNVLSVAEGVENQAQLDFLNNHGCDIVQGFMFSKPLELNEFEQAYLAIRDSA